MCPIFLTFYLWFTTFFLVSLNKTGIQARKHLASNPAITLPSWSSPVPLKPAVPLCFSGRQPVMLAGIIHNFLASCTLISGRFFTSKNSKEVRKCPSRHLGFLWFYLWWVSLWSQAGGNEKLEIRSSDHK